MPLPLVVAAVVAVTAWQHEPEAAPPAAPDLQAEAAAWVRAHAIAFTTPLVGSGFDDLAGLDAIVGDARVVSLGEPTHGTREAFQMTNRLLEYLVEKKGFSIFAAESSLPEAYDLNAYIVDGAGDPKQIVAEMSAWPYKTEEFLAMVEWMRAWNEKNPVSAGKPRLQFLGFDVEPSEAAWKAVDEVATTAAPDLVDTFKDLHGNIKRVTSARPYGSPPLGWTSATGSFPASLARGRKLRFSCWIRTEDVGKRALAWVMCGTPDGMGGVHQTTNDEIRGTTEWSRQEFTVDIPVDTPDVTFGFMVAGGGAAWFDDVEFELDGVIYDDPDVFSLDFENDQVNFLGRVSGGYTMKRSSERPHGGKKSLEIRGRPQRDGSQIDPEGVRDRAKAVVGDLQARRDDLAGKLGAKEAERAIQNARVLAQCAEMYASNDSVAARDECMARNVQWILNQNPGQKVVLWAHNRHVAKADRSGHRTMGRNLAGALGDQMIVFGFASGTGVYAAFAPGGELKSDNPLAPPREDSVEAMFGETGVANVILDIRGAKPGNAGARWLTNPLAMRTVGSVAMPPEHQYYTCAACESYDVLVWQGTTSSVRMLDGGRVPSPTRNPWQP